MPNTPEDPRYATLRILIDAGKLKTLREILDYIPIEVLAKDLNEDAGYLHDLFYNTKDIGMGTINALAELIDCEFEQVAMLAVRQFEADKMG